jgi:peptide/nickel transport system substrate-binding protein
LYRALTSRYVIHTVGSANRQHVAGAKPVHQLEHGHARALATHCRPRLQAGFSGWAADFTAPAVFVASELTCDSYNTDNAANANFAEFCDRAIDHEIERVQALQATDPEAGTRRWAKIDRDVTNRAPWVAYANGVVLEIVSDRVRNYQFNPQWGTLLDQLWMK